MRARRRGFRTMVFFGHTPNDFLYALRPSATWGAGKVGRLVIEVDASKLREDVAPVTGISLPGYTEQDGVYRWELHDFDLRNAKDFRFTYDLRVKMQSEEALRELLPREAVGSIEVSSCVSLRARRRRPTARRICSTEIFRPRGSKARRMWARENGSKCESRKAGRYAALPWQMATGRARSVWRKTAGSRRCESIGLGRTPTDRRNTLVTRRRLWS